MLLLVSGATRYPRDGTVGHLIVPGSWNSPTSLKLQPGRWAMDNGAFGGGFDPGQFVTMLEAFSGETGCLFVSAPDVIYKSGIGDAAATRRRWPFWSRLIRGLGFPPALIAQDGLQGEQIPWGELGALFIGGSTQFKESTEARSMVAYAIAQDVWVHWGRVNGKRRLELILKAMGDYGRWSFDGTGFSMYPDVNIPLVDDWRREIEEQPELQM
jgi:hypothetical protein